MGHAGVIPPPGETPAYRPCNASRLQYKMCTEGAQYAQIAHPVGGGFEYDPPTHTPTSNTSHPPYQAGFHYIKVIDDLPPVA